MAITPEQFKRALAHFAAGVTVVTTRAGPDPVGVTASSFTSVSLEPPLVLVCLQKRLFSHQAIAERGTFAVNMLNADQVELGMRFAGQRPGIKDRFADLTVKTAITGDPILAECLAWVDCRVWAIYDGGDHSIFVGEVLASSTERGAEPLLYFDRQWHRGQALTIPELLLPAAQGAARGAGNGHNGATV